MQCITDFAPPVTRKCRPSVHPRLPTAMSRPRVLIGVRDDALRETLFVALDEAGCAVAMTSDPVLLRAALQVSTQPLIVILDHGGHSGFAEDVLEHLDGTQRHAYLLLSTNPTGAIHVWNPTTERQVPILPEPFDLNTLEELVFTTAALLGAHVYLPR